MPPMPSSPLAAMLDQIVSGFARLLPRSQPQRQARDWEDSDRTWHNSSFDLSAGLAVVEHFEPMPVFPDTMPAFHYPPSTQALAR